MLTYMEVHLYFTLPILVALFWLLKPFHSRNDAFKYQFLVGMAVSTASIWDNYIVYHKAWSYCPTCVVAVIGYVPLEEYMFFIIMTLMTVAFTNLVMRWHLPSVFLQPRTPWIQTLFVRFVPILGLVFTAYRAWKSALPGKPLFYGSCILWYTCPVLALLWYGSGEYMLRRPLSVLISITVPTLYLCWVDKVAIHAGVWHISLRTSTGHFVAPDLPLEEFMFFALINTILVFATCALDRAQAIIHLFYPTGDSFLHLLRAFAVPDQFLNNEVLQDLTVTWSILKKSSKSFHTASTVFPYPVRQDLGVLYGFCRATDDLCDNERVALDTRKQQLESTRHFVKTMFSEKSIRWEMYPEQCVPAFRAFARIRSSIDEEAVQELLDGYQWDLERRVVKTEADLIYYSHCVASSVGEMCTRLILHHEGRPQDEWIVERAREMGLVLQYINIARDIVTDSRELGRTYIPSDWLTADEEDLLSLGKARELGDDRLMALARQLTDKADKIKKQAERGISHLPASCQGGVRAACNVYSAIGKVLKQSKGYPTRAYMGKSERALVALASVYSD